MAFALTLVLAAATVQAPAEAPSSRGARVTALGHAVAVILPAVTNEADSGTGAIHRRAVQGPGGASIVFE